MWRVSTTVNGDPADADALAARWGLEVVARRALGDAPALLVGRDALWLRVAGRSVRWHPGMLHARRASADRHPLVALTGVGPGDVVLDATLGMGHDAAFLAGVTGRAVLGVEAVPIVAAWAADGLRRAGHAVDVVIGDGAAVLAGLAPGSVDVVVADPMFPEGGVGPSLDPLRRLVAPSPLDGRWLALARRAARRGVLVRDEHPGALLEALGAPVVHGRDGRRARYGWWPGGA